MTTRINVSATDEFAALLDQIANEQGWTRSQTLLALATIGARGLGYVVPAPMAQHGGGQTNRPPVTIPEGWTYDGVFGWGYTKNED